MFTTEKAANRAGVPGGRQQHRAGAPSWRPVSAAAGPSSADLLALQRAVGSAATARLLQGQSRGVASGDAPPPLPPFVQRKGILGKIGDVLLPKGKDPAVAREEYLTDSPFGVDRVYVMKGDRKVIRAHAIRILGNLIFENDRMDALYWSGVLSGQDRGKATKPPGWDQRSVRPPDLRGRPEVVRKALVMWHSWNEYRYWTAWIFEGDDSLIKRAYRRGQIDEARRAAVAELTQKAQYANFAGDQLGDQAAEVIKLAT